MIIELTGIGCEILDDSNLSVLSLTQEIPNESEEAFIIKQPGKLACFMTILLIFLS